jgi:DNA-binding HxlR family transcriptional regulator
MNQIKADPFNKNCPSRMVLEIISDKWVILIIDILAKNPQHFGELKKIIGGISQKVLSQSLKKLEMYGFINRRCYSEKPLRVEYSLTLLGISLSDVCNQITEWSINHIDEILSASLREDI